MNLEAAAQLALYRTSTLTGSGTSEGAVKGWDTRGRGRHDLAPGTKGPATATPAPVPLHPLTPGVKVDRYTEGPLTPREQEVQERFAKQIEKDPQGAVDEYRKQFQNVINPDNAKELSVDYRADRSANASAVHEPSSWLAKQVYKQLLEEPTKPGQYKSAFFMTGGPGVGKTTAINGNKTLSSIISNSHAVVDGTFANANSAQKKIDQALAAGHTAIVAYVHRDPSDAFENGILKRASKVDANGESGRTVPISWAANSYVNVRKSLDGLVDHYKDNPNVHFVGIDNSRGMGNAKFMKYQDLPPMKDTPEELSKKFSDILEKKYADGKISQKVYLATKA